MKGDKNLKEIQLKNFRSLKNTELQTIAPITLLVGENSSGKSSFLRVFPLLKQSINKRTSGPILWSGDIDDYVDFGSFEETVTNDDSNEIIFRFKFSIKDLQHRSPFIERHSNTKEDIDFEITVKSQKSKEYVSLFILKLNNIDLTFNLEENSIKIDDYIYSSNTKNNNSNTSFQDSLFFNKFIATKSKAFGFSLPEIEELWNKLSQIIYKKTNEKEPNEYSLFRMHNIIFELGDKLFHNEQIQQTANQQKEFNSSLKSTYPNIYNNLLKSICEDNELINVIRICYVYIVFSEIDSYILNYFKNVHYIAPLRATAERYYRLRNLAVDEVDYQGKNLAIFINSLSPKKTKEFNIWTMDNFGFSINTDKSKGHLSLIVKLKDSSKAINLSDTGFGYSQVLPIITQLWELSTRSIKKDDFFLTPLVVAIEQPELHLHPAVQAKLARAFIACIKLAEKNGYQLQLLLETHSETIVNYLGRAISKGELSPNDVSVILFEKRETDAKTIVKNSMFDESGYLINWPYGFFDSED